MRTASLSKSVHTLDDLCISFTSIIYPPNHDGGTHDNCFVLIMCGRPSGHSSKPGPQSSTSFLSGGLTTVKSTEHCWIATDVDVEQL